MNTFIYITSRTLLGGWRFFITRVIREGGKLTSNDKTWSYLPHLHTREREEDGRQGTAVSYLKNCCSKPEQDSSLKRCYYNPDCSVNKEWHYLRITHTQEWSQSPGRIQTRHLCVTGTRQLCLCPRPERDPGWKHHCYFTGEVCKLLQAKIAFFLARWWRLKPLNPALLESICLAVTEKSIPDKAKPHNLPSPWCWWLSSHSVCGKYHYPHYGDSSQDRARLCLLCSDRYPCGHLWAVPNSATLCQGCLSPCPAPREGWTLQRWLVSTDSTNDWSLVWDSTWKLFLFPSSAGLSCLCPGPQDSPFPYVFLQGKCPVPGSC